MKKIINLMAIVAIITCASCNKFDLGDKVSDNFPSKDQVAIGHPFSGSVYRTTAPVQRDINKAYVGLPAFGSTVSLEIIENGILVKGIPAIIESFNPDNLFEVKDPNGRWDNYTYDEYGALYGYGVFRYSRSQAFTLTMAWEQVPPYYPVFRRRLQY